MFFLSKIEEGKIDLVFNKNQDMIVDVLTKRLRHSEKHNHFKHDYFKYDYFKHD